jgi:hypothetical protein
VVLTIVIAGLGLASGAGADTKWVALRRWAPLPGRIDPSAFLPADRARSGTGMMGVGGIPVRSKACSRLPPWRGDDDTAPVQGAIIAYPPGKVVQLAAALSSSTVANASRGSATALGPAQALRAAGQGAL